MLEEEVGVMPFGWSKILEAMYTCTPVASFARSPTILVLSLALINFQRWRTGN